MESKEFHFSSKLPLYIPANLQKIVHNYMFAKCVTDDCVNIQTKKTGLCFSCRKEYYDRERYKTFCGACHECVSCCSH